MLVFVALMFILFPFVLIASLFGEKLSGKLVYGIVTFWADAAMFLWGMPHRNIYENDYHAERPVIFVFNHISYIDIPVLLKAFRQQPIRVLGKAEMANIPIFGFFYRKAVILVKRDNAEDRAKSLDNLRKALNDGISVVIAPEGTFNMTNKPLSPFYDGAFRMAIETKTTIQPVIFPDTYDRMHYRSIFSMSPGKSRAVFLQPIHVDNSTLHDLASLKMTVYRIMEDALISYEAGWINEKVS